MWINIIIRLCSVYYLQQCERSVRENCKNWLSQLVDLSLFISQVAVFPPKFYSNLKLGKITEAYFRTYMYVEYGRTKPLSYANQIIDIFNQYAI